MSKGAHGCNLLAAPRGRFVSPEPGPLTGIRFHVPGTDGVAERLHRNSIGTAWGTGIYFAAEASRIPEADEAARTLVGVDLTGARLLCPPSEEEAYALAHWLDTVRDTADEGWSPDDFELSPAPGRMLAFHAAPAACRDSIGHTGLQACGPGVGDASPVGVYLFRRVADALDYIADKQQQGIDEPEDYDIWAAQVDPGLPEDSSYPGAALVSSEAISPAALTLVGEPSPACLYAPCLAASAPAFLAVSEDVIAAAIEAARDDLLVARSPGTDSAGTRIMKALGYDGVDVRHLPALDSVYFGSVLFV